MAWTPDKSKNSKVSACMYRVLFEDGDGMDCSPEEIKKSLYTPPDTVQQTLSELLEDWLVGISECLALKADSVTSIHEGEYFVCSDLPDSNATTIYKMGCRTDPDE